MIKIVIIESDDKLRSKWKKILDDEIDMHVVNDYDCCERAFELESFKLIQIVIMSNNLSGKSGIEGLKYLKLHYPGISTIMTIPSEEEKNILEALKLGAIGNLPKDTGAKELVKAIHCTLQGGSPVPPHIARKMVQSFQNSTSRPNPRSFNLNERELQILKGLASGHSYANIGASIFLSVDGIRYHIRNIYEKLHVHSRTAAVNRAIKERILQPPD